MKKKMIAVFLAVLTVFLLCSCAKCIDTQTSTVKVKVVDKIYQAPQPGRKRTASGKQRRYTKPAEYKTVVEYNGKRYYVSGKATYDTFSDKIGTEVEGVLQTEKYDDGSVVYSIIRLMSDE